VLGLGEVDEDELYQALDWLLQRQPAIEATLAKRHLSNGTLVLYDVSSSYMEGRCCPLAKRGYSRDGKRGVRRQAASCNIFDGRHCLRYAIHLNARWHSFCVAHCVAVLAIGDKL
jgi:hypothetical protein